MQPDGPGGRGRRLAALAVALPVRITATQPLTAFNLDLLLPVRGVAVDGAVAAWARPNAFLDAWLRATTRPGRTTTNELL